MVLQVEESGRALDIGEDFGAGHLITYATLARSSTKAIADPHEAIKIQNIRGSKCGSIFSDMKKPNLFRLG
jgi:hypothetical protein